MKESINKTFNHFKVHTQYSICEGAVKIDQLKDFCKLNKIKSLGISDTLNLSGALEFSENLSSVGTQPIIGTQILFKYKNFIGFLPILAKNNEGYKNIIELSSKSYLDNSEITDPHCNFEDLLNNSSGIIVLSGSIRCLIGNLFNKGLIQEIEEIIFKLSKRFKNDFYIEIQRHNDLNEKEFENFNLSISKKFDLPIIATNEVYYLDQNMHEAHDALMCIGNKTYVNDVNRIKLSNQHYYKTSEDMIELFKDLPEALENNFALPYRCSFRPIPSKPILPNITSSDIDNNELLKNDSYKGLKDKFKKILK
jgi:DNA polymerase III, alpha subunit